jgi:predicted secreted protein
MYHLGEKVMKLLNIGLVSAVFFLGAVSVRAEGPLPSASETSIELNITVKKDVMQDTLSAALNFRVEGQDVDQVQQQINKKMAKVWEVSKQAGGVKARHTGYRVWFDDGKDRGSYGRRQEQPTNLKLEPKWVGLQSIFLHSKDIDALKTLVLDLQGMGLAMTHFGFGVSASLREKTEKELMPDAARKLTAQAKLLATSFGSQVVALKELSLGGRNQNSSYASMASYSRSRGSSGERLAPVAEPVTEQVFLTLGGLAIIKPVLFD